MTARGVLYSLLAALLMIALMIPVTPAPADQGGAPHVPGEIIIKYKPGTTEHDKDQLRSELHGHQMKAWGRIRAEINHLDDMTVEEAMSRLQGNPHVEYAEPNYIVSINEVPNDPMFNQLWGMQNTGQTGGTAGADIHATSAWDVFTGSDSVLIGVIDTGVDYTHPDLAANIWTNPGEIPGNGIDDDGNGYIDDIHGWDFINHDNDPMDDHGHGSHVSGTIGAVGDNGIGVAGVNWHVKIMALKFLSASGSGSTDDAVSAIEYATTMGVNLTSNSWGGGGFSQTLYDAIADAGAHNMLFVAAAGNSGANSDLNPEYPGAYDLPNIVCVAATDDNDQLASFSNYGVVSVDLAAPGVDILSTFPGNSYGSISGTSMATPHVSGALGLIFGRFPNIDALDAKNLLLNNVDPLPNLSGIVLSGGRLNAFLPIAEPDSLPPAQIDDLAAGGVGSNWVDLAWTAVGDDGNTGTASRYDLRYSTSPITPANFGAAAKASGAPDPGVAGTPESMHVDGLDFSTPYYFAVKALDEFGNAGPVSNVASATTLGPPDVDVTPTSLTETLLTGATSTQNLTLSNVNANTTLDFQIPLPELLTNPSSVYAYLDVPKGGVDSRTGDPVTLGSGGPDGFGYRWVDSDEAVGPAFAWIDISASGTVAMSTGDDASSGPFPIGFDFPFYGVNYSQFQVCSNGFLSFTSNSTAYSNQPLPNGGAPPALVAPFWDDLDVAGGTVYFENTGTQLIVQWDAVGHYNGGGPYTFQAILDQDGSITYQYLSMGSPGNSATVGIQNASRSDGLTVAFNVNYIHDNLALRIEAVPQWMTVAPGSGTLLGPGNTTLSVNFDAGGLLGGTYEGNIRVFSNDPDENPFVVPVTLTVIGAPDIAVDPTSYDFGQVFFGSTPTADFAVRNPGTDTLHVASVGFDDGAYTADQSAFDVPPHGAVGLTVTFDPPSVGTYPAVMTITSDDPDQGTLPVALSGEAVPPPDFSVTPSSLSADLLTGQSVHKTLTVQNTGGADLDFDITLDLGTQVQQYDAGAELAKGAAEPGPGVLGTGGPDNYGYQWIDSDEAGGPTYDWVDISAVGTPVYTGSSNDDVTLGPFPIGFAFSFYGSSFTEFNVCSNGFLSFTSTSHRYTNTALPSASASDIPENLLAAFWDDLNVDLSVGGQVFYYNDGSRLIVQFQDVRKLGQSSGPYNNFELILYPNGTVVYQYDSMGPTLNSATVGIQNAARDDGLTVVYNDDYVHAGLAVRFSATPPWLNASPLSGTVPPGDSLHVDVLLDASGLFGGRYEGGVILNTNDPVAPQVTVPTVLNVTGAPDIDVSPLAVDFGQVFVGYPDLHTFTIRNMGTDLLTVSALNSSDPAFGVDFTGITLPLHLNPLQAALVTVRFSPTVPGPASAVLSVVSNDADEPTVAVALSGEGVPPPAGAVTPDSVYANLLTGEIENQTVTLTNTGASDLNFEVHTLTTLADKNPPVAPLDHELAKGEEDPRTGILGSGGPDSFGYQWIDSDEPGGPIFSWQDISSTGTAVFSSTSDDVNAGPFPVGFTFPFYGNTFTDFRVSSNGWVSFTNTTSDLSNDPLPSPGGPENLLAVFWDDMVVDLSVGGQVYYEYDGTKLVIQYDGVKKYGSNSPPYYTFQILLYPNGTIVYQYLTLGATVNSATIGIQNDTRDVALNVVYNTAYAHDDLAIRIGSSPDWLSATPATGTVPAGGSLPVNVRFNAGTLFGGRYDGEVRILTNDPAHGLLRVGARLDVTGVPRAGFDPDSLDFGNVFIGYPDTLSFTLTNVGTDHLSVTSMSPGSGDYAVSPATAELDPLQSAQVTVAFSPLAPGPRNAVLTVNSNDPDSPGTVTLLGNGVVAPVMTVAPDTMIGAACPGETKTKIMTVCNTGGSDLTFTAAAAEHAGASVVVYGFVQTPKGSDVEGGAEAKDPRPGIQGTGGPDTFGYRWTDSDEPGGPAYDWTDISAVGTAFDFGGGYRDDANSGPLPIGFSFPFYGQNFTQVRACTNGWMSFTSSSTAYSNQPLPNSGAPENLLAVFWDDMVFDESYGADAYYYYDGTKATFQFDHVRRLGEFTSPYFSYQVILYPNGNVLYQYKDLAGTVNSSTVGIQNGAQNDGLTVVYNAEYLHTGMAVLFSTRPAWLSVSPESGTVAPGQCLEMTVTMDASALDEGDYTGAVTMTSNDPANPNESMEVMFHVLTVYATAVSMDPNTLNMGSNGKYVTGSVELPPEYDPSLVDPSTVTLNGAVVADANKSSIGDFNNNGVPDWSFKFLRADVEAALDAGDSVAVTISGEIDDVACFVGTAVIRVIRPHLTVPNGGEYFAQGMRVDLAWTDPQGWPVDHAALYYSVDDGVSWNLVADGVQGETYNWLVPEEITDTARMRVYLFDNHGVMGYDGSDAAFHITQAAAGTGGITPKVHALYQNSPNPFRGATRIGFDLPAPSRVELTIFDVSGRAVRSFTPGELPAGNFKITWDGRDTAGKPVASGIYFYRIQAGDFTAVKRMFIMN